MGDHDKLSEWVEDVARDGTKDRNGSSGGGIFGKLFG